MMPAFILVGIIAVCVVIPFIFAYVCYLHRRTRRDTAPLLA